MAGEELAVRDPDFEARASVGDVSRMRLAGNAEGSVANQLTVFVEDLHARVLAAGTAAIHVDIRDLEFMNATCFNILVSWVNRINDLPPERRYQLRFSTNPAIPWQRRSLRTLSCFSTDLVLVES